MCKQACFMHIYVCMCARVFAQTYVRHHVLVSLWISRHEMFLLKMKKNVRTGLSTTIELGLNIGARIHIIAMSPTETE